MPLGKSGTSEDNQDNWFAPAPVVRYRTVSGGPGASSIGLWMLALVVLGLAIGKR